MIQTTTDHELVIARHDFDQVMASLLTNPDLRAVGRLTRNHAKWTTHWAVKHLSLSSHILIGTDLAMLADWFVITSNADAGPYPADYWRTIFHPLPSQTLIVLSLGLLENRSGWCGWILNGEDHQLLARVRIVGGPYLDVFRDTPNETEIDQTPSPSRWTRLRNALGEDLLSRLFDFHVVLFGASRTGSTMARELAAIGVGKLSIADPDTLELHNFDAMLGGNIRDVGMPKVKALARELIRFRDDMSVTGLPWTATDTRVIDRARDANAIITCADHGTPVLLAAKMANAWNILHLDIGTGVQHLANGELQIAADVRMLFPHEACASCVGGIADRAEAELEIRLPAGAIPLRPTTDFREERAGSLVTINAIAVSIGVQKLLDTLSGHLRHSQWTRLQYHQGRGLEVHEEFVDRSAECQICDNGNSH